MAEFVTVMKERKRMCSSFSRNCGTICYLSSHNNGVGCLCTDYVIRYPEEAEKIIMKWAAEHPVETMKDRFFKMFPNAPKDENGYPECCPHQLGWAKCGRCKDFETCLQYWNRPYEENK